MDIIVVGRRNLPLKIRIKQLANESQETRVRQAIANYNAESDRNVVKLTEAGFNDSQIKRILFRASRRQVNNSRKYVGQSVAEATALHYYRTVTLRKESRRHQLAQAFLRGVPYSRVELAAYSSPDWDEIEKTAWRFSLPFSMQDATTAVQIRRQRFAQWQDEAKVHFEANRLSPSPKVVESKAADDGVFPSE